MEYDDIEWEEADNSNAQTTTTTTTTTTSFDKGILDEFDDEEEEEEEENKNNESGNIGNDKEKEEEEETGIEFEIDTNEYKAKPTIKPKRVVKKVDLREKHNCLFLHKAVLVLYISSFQQTIKTLSNQQLNSILLSTIPTEIVKLYSMRIGIDINNNNNSITTTTTNSTISFKVCMNEIIKWFSSVYKIDEADSNSKKKEVIDVDDESSNKFTIDKSLVPKNSLLFNQIFKQMKEKITSKKIYVELFYMVCRLLGYKVRIVRPILSPPPVPITPSKLKRINNSGSPTLKSRSRSKSSTSIAIRLNDNSDNEEEEEEDKDSKKKKKSPIVKKSKQTTTNTNTTPSKSRSSTSKKEVKESAPKKKKAHPVFNLDSTDEEDNQDDEDEDEDEIVITNKPVTKRQQTLLSNSIKNTILNDKVSKSKSESKLSKKRKEIPSFSSTSKKDEDNEDEEDDDGEKKKKLKRSLSDPIKISKSKDNDKQVTTTTTTTSESKLFTPISNWVEVFNFNEKRWISIDIVNNRIDKSNLFEDVTDPFSYVVSICDDQIKDVTSRYTNNYIGSSLKRLPIVQLKWWFELLNQHQPPSTTTRKSNQELKMIEEIEKSESKERIEKESSVPFPTSLSQFKSHPIFVLEKDIPKYSSVNPNLKPLGIFDGKHKIYHKDHVEVLHTADKWVEKNRQVIEQSQPAKVVKSRSKSNPTALLFGKWQTKPYEPAIIQSNNLIPVNSYGNVYMFHPSMTPINGTHLRGTGLIKIAKKLGIPVAPALVGWELTSKASYPLIDGVIVATIFAKTLYNTWLSESENKEITQQQKKNEEIRKRWSMFMKKLLIKNYIENTYNNNNQNSNNQINDDDEAEEAEEEEE